jgi:hypothetical protein
MKKPRLLFSTFVAVLALGALTASSASAFSWWVGSTSKTSEELAEGAKLTFSPTANVKSPFTLKWFGAYEVRCAAATYDELFIEGRLGIGAGGIHFESCSVTKPAGYKVIGGTIDTAPLTGAIAPSGSNVDFTLASADGPFASFVLENETSCTFDVSVVGTAAGTLPAASKLKKEKFLKFGGSTLGVSQSKNCGIGLKERGKKHQEEGDGKVEANKGNVGYSSEPSFWSAH